jgi:pyrimidine deaminase RibD-like protein
LSEGEIMAVFPPLPDRCYKILALLAASPVGDYAPEPGRNPPLLDTDLADVWDQDDVALLNKLGMLEFEECLPAANFRFVKIKDEGRACLAEWRASQKLAKTAQGAGNGGSISALPPCPKCGGPIAEADLVDLPDLRPCPKCRSVGKLEEVGSLLELRVMLESNPKGLDNLRGWRIIRHFGRLLWGSEFDAVPAKPTKPLELIVDWFVAEHGKGLDGPAELTPCHEVVDLLQAAVEAKLRSEGPSQPTANTEQRETKGETVQWLISEVFSPAKWIGERLAAANDDNGIPAGVYGVTSTGAPATVGYVFRDECRKPLSRLEEGLKRADKELQSLPPDVAAEVRTLQRIVNGAVGTISFYDGAKYYAGSDIGPTGQRGWSAIIRHVKGIPFPSAAATLTPDQATGNADLTPSPTCVAEGEISECYTLRDLLHDLASIRITNDRANALREKSEGPASAFIEDPSKTYDIQSFRNYYAMAAAEFFSSASQQADGLKKRPAVDRLRTLCIARAGVFSDIVLQQLCADAAVTAGKTLDDLLLLDTATVADLLQDQREGSGGAGPTTMLAEAADTRVTDLDFPRKFMEMAVAEARKSKAEDDRVHPKVGVVVVKGGAVLATAYRGEIGKGEHAEYTALEKKLPDAAVAGATVYTTLEPCTSRHDPKIPCADRLIARKIRRVVIGMLDPDSRVSGKGQMRLRKANVAVCVFDHDLQSEIEELNRDFIRDRERASGQQSTDRPVG